MVIYYKQNYHFGSFSEGNTILKTLTQEKRLYIIDILKIIACFFVIRIHIGALTPPEQFVCIAVPVFIFITSYNYTQSCELHDMLTIKKWFTLRNLSNKFKRLYVPYIAFAICQLILIVALKADYGLITVITAFFTGGFGPGNYYLLLMFQIIILYPFLLCCNKKRPKIALATSLVFYLIYYIVMYFVFHDDLYDVTSLGGAINKWTVFRWIFLLESGIYFFIRRDKIKWWQLVLLSFADIIPFILQYTTALPTLYIRGIPYNFIAIAAVGLCIKYLNGISFGKLNFIIEYCGKATWHIFLFQQLYFWLIGMLAWQTGNTFISFPVCFIGGLIFYTVNSVFTKLINKIRRKP